MTAAPDDPTRAATLLRLDVAALASADPAFALAARIAGVFPIRLRPPGFGTLLRIILEQQVSTAAAAAMWRRLCDRLGAAAPGPPLPDSVAPGSGAPGSVAPGPFLALDDDALRACGFSRQKARYGRALAEEVRDGRLDLEALAGLDDEAAMARLCALPGIGRWSAENYLLWALGRPDVLPAQDLALQLGWQWLTETAERPTAAALRTAAEPWRPRRTAASLLIWHFYLARVAERRGSAGR